MSAHRGFPELPSTPQNKHVAKSASWLFSQFPAGGSPTVKRFYESHPHLLEKTAGLFSSGHMAIEESRYVKKHADSSHPADNLAKRTPTILRAVAAGAFGGGLITSHQMLRQAHPDMDLTQFSGS